MSSNSRLAEMIQARIGTRESSTLTIATVAASASLVLLALSASPGSYNSTTHHSWLRFGGFLFALLGILYRETTILTIDAQDHAMLNQISLPISDRRGRGHFMRSFLLRALLISSLAAWSSLLFQALENIGSSLLGANWFLFKAMFPFFFWSVFLPMLVYGERRHKCVALGAFLIACTLFIAILLFPHVVMSTDAFAVTGGLYVVLASAFLTWMDA